MSREERFPVGAAVGLEELARDAHPVLARLRRVEPVSWVPALGGWLVTGYDVAVRVMRDPATFTVDDPRFSTARVVGRSMLSTDADEHRRHRAPFVAPFRPSQVAARFSATVEDFAEALVGRLRGRREADLRTVLAGPLSVAVVAATLGLETVEPATVLRWYSRIVEAVTDLTPDHPVPEPAARAVGELHDHLHASLTGDDGSLLAEAGRSLREDELFADAAVMMFGGIETTEGMIANALRHVLLEDGLAERVRTTPALLAPVVEESLRLEPAAAVVDRYASVPVGLGPADVAAGDLVRVSLSGANRDPAVFADPDRFRPDRPEARSQLSFARGPHVCVAMDLARLEARVALRVALERLPGLRLVGEDPPTGLVFRKPARVRVAWDAV